VGLLRHARGAGVALGDGVELDTATDELDDGISAEEEKTDDAASEVVDDGEAMEEAVDEIVAGDDEDSDEDTREDVDEDWDKDADDDKLAISELDETTVESVLLLTISMVVEELTDNEKLLVEELTGEETDVEVLKLEDCEVAEELEAALEAKELADDDADSKELLVDLDVAKVEGRRELDEAALHFPNPFWHVAASQ